MVEETTDCLRLSLPTVSTSDTATLTYECFFCKGKAAAAHTFTLNTFDLPITATGKTSGL